MLVGNGIRSGGNPCRFLGGISTAHQVERSSYNQHGAVRSSLVSEAKNAAAKTAGYPNGYEAGGAWCLPRKGGGLSSHNRMFGVGELSAAMQTARNLEARATSPAPIWRSLSASSLRSAARATSLVRSPAQSDWRRH